MFEEVLTALKVAEDVYGMAERLLAAAKAKGDPVPEEVVAQMAASKAANDRLHAIVNGTA